MVRRRRDESVARITVATDREAAELRGRCALAVLSNVSSLLTAYDAAPDLLADHRVDDRAVDLFAPLLALAIVADSEDGGVRAPALIELACEVADARDGRDSDGTTPRLVAALQQIGTSGQERVTPTELLRALRAEGFEWVKTTKTLAAVLAPLGLYSRSARREGGKGRMYLLNAGELADLAKRSGPADLDAAESGTPSGQPS
jgi:hypothetical protein